MSNAWLDSNKQKIERLERQLVEYAYRGSYGGEIPLMELHKIIQGAKNEIKRLQVEIENFKNKK